MRSNTWTFKWSSCYFRLRKKAINRADIAPIRNEPMNIIMKSTNAFNDSIANVWFSILDWLIDQYITIATASFNIDSPKIYE